MASDNNSLKRTITHLEAKVSDLKSEVEDLEETVEDVEAQIANKAQALIIAHDNYESLNLRYTHLMTAYIKLEQSEEEGG